jgi:hypothetical protein
MPSRYVLGDILSSKVDIPVCVQITVKQQDINFIKFI